METIAIVYDFDRTLTTRPMREFISWPELSDNEKHRMWDDDRASHVREDEDRELFWMRKVTQYANLQPSRLTRRFLRKQGGNVTFFPGVEGFLAKIGSYVQETSSNSMICRQYIISSSIKEVIEGTRIASSFKYIFASMFHYEGEKPTFPQILVNDAVKTQCLYRINKGREHWAEDVNEYMPVKERPVPFSNMIYVGDGLTDIPALAVVRRNGGFGVGVYSNTNKNNLAVLRELIDGERIDFAAEADYSDESVLSAGLRTIIRIIIAKARLRVLKDNTIRQFHFDR